MYILSVTESAVRQIREEIITGRLPAGSRLHEVEISERFGISRPPLREAFRILANENLVVSVPRKGSFVAPMSLADCEHIYRVRQTLECTAIDLISEKPSGSLDLLRKALEEARDPVPGESAFDHFRTMSLFHLRLIEATGNNWLIRCHLSLQSSLARYQVMYLSLPDSYIPSLDEHIQILSLLENGKYDQAKHHLVAHLIRVKKRLCAKIPDESSAPEAPSKRAS